MNRIRTIGKVGFGIVKLYQATDRRQFAVKQMLRFWNNNHFERFKKVYIEFGHLTWEDGQPDIYAESIYKDNFK